MANPAIFVAIALIAAHVPVAAAREGDPAPQAAVQMARYSADNGAVPTETPPPGADAAGPGSPVKPAQSRGQPRVSKTRCAIVTCEAPCEAHTKRDAPANVAAAPQTAPCPVRQVLG